MPQLLLLSQVTLLEGKVLEFRMMNLSIQRELKDGLHHNDALAQQCPDIELKNICWRKVLSNKL